MKTIFFPEKTARKLIGINKFESPLEVEIVSFSLDLANFNYHNGAKQF